MFFTEYFYLKNVSQLFYVKMKQKNDVNLFTSN